MDRSAHEECMSILFFASSIEFMPPSFSACKFLRLSNAFHQNRLQWVTDNTKFVGCEQFYANQRQCPSDIFPPTEELHLYLTIANWLGNASRPEAMLNWANSREGALVDLLDVESSPEVANTSEYLPAIESAGLYDLGIFGT